MTASDPRVGEIEARLAAATPGPWFLDADGDSGVYTEARASNSSSEIASAFRREDEAFIAHAPADVAYLLAELRKAHEALARVEELASAWTARGEHDMAFSKTVPDEDIAMVLLTEGASMVENARHIRAAVAAANGGGQ